MPPLAPAHPALLPVLHRLWTLLPCARNRPAQLRQLFAICVAMNTLVAVLGYLALRVRLSHRLRVVPPQRCPAAAGGSCVAVL